jgi:hypothetical protein
LQEKAFYHIPHCMVDPHGQQGQKVVSEECHFRDTIRSCRVVRYDARFSIDHLGSCHCIARFKC